MYILKSKLIVFLLNFGLLKVINNNERFNNTRRLSWGNNSIVLTYDNKIILHIKTTKIKLIESVIKDIKYVLEMCLGYDKVLFSYSLTYHSKFSGSVNIKIFCKDGLNDHLI